jgi:hypothetical protein
MVLLRRSILGPGRHQHICALRHGDSRTHDKKLHGYPSDDRNDFSVDPPILLTVTSSRHLGFSVLLLPVSPLGRPSVYVNSQGRTMMLDFNACADIVRR